MPPRLAALETRPPLTRPAMSNERDRRGRIALTSRYVELDGRPAIPVSGELHYSRVPRSQWRERLQLMRSGGVTVVSTYVIWIHHEPVRGEPRFADGLDVAAFVRLAAEVGLDVVVRIGPWCHGEVRNGGFPHWVAEASVAHRTDDPAYLDLVRGWFDLIGRELAPLCGPDSPVIGIQVENELIDRPGHLATLVGLAREAGLAAPIWTATAWDGAELPPEVVMPVFGGYADGFWVDADAPWPSSFRAHFRFSHDWDDPGIGADLRGERADAPAAAGTAAPPRARAAASPDFPVATCELGGGMATAYHRRPLPGALDLATVANAKLGSGSNWQGYYMYAGGLNPGDGLQESLATGYPNDLPRFDYDFHAPIGAAGILAPSHAALRIQHAFLAAFGDRLAPMTSRLPERMPRADDDRSTLRWAVRSEGDAGFLFVGHHEPFDALAAVAGVRFEVALASGTALVPPSSRPPLTIPPGTVARWPLGLALGGAVVEWATASVVTVLGADRTPDPSTSAAAAVPTLVLLAEPGVPATVSVSTDVASAPLLVDARDDDGPTLHRLRDDHAELDLLILPATWADELWVLDARSGERMVLRSRSPLWLDDDALRARSDRTPHVERYDPTAGAFVGVAFDGTDSQRLPVRHTEVVRFDPNLARADFGGTPARRAAPTAYDLDRLAVRIPLEGLGSPEDGVMRTLLVEWAGDVATLEVDGRTVADRFWDGTPWLVDLDAASVHASAQVVLRILQLHPDAKIHLPPAAAARRRTHDGPLGSLDRLVGLRSTVWRAIH
ncbi:beta-galactosidase [Agromyces bracchium]|uniref:Beta-galactosidase n=3 Tax=Agromyces bracchium TaxID=88376 RepID=A0A6I3M7M6_9MICO|nr:beta-galactosidase [Agromyces bracchium]